MSVGDRVAAGKQGDFVTKGNELFREPRDHPFRASVISRGNALVKWRNLSDPHPPDSFSDLPFFGRCTKGFSFTAFRSLRFRAIAGGIFVTMFRCSPRLTGWRVDVASRTPLWRC